MRISFKRVIGAILGILLFVLVFLVAYGVVLVRSSFPQTTGELILPGLEHPVEVYRDDAGVPHIYARSSHDLFLAQGYIHAQERFWQMDFWRHLGAGRLSEMFGKSQVKTDMFLRTLGWARIAEEEWASATPEMRVALQAYTDGVNAYLAAHKGAGVSLEYAVLKLINPEYRIEPWTPVNTLTWAKAMAWSLGGNMHEEIERAVLLKQVGADRTAELFPPYPSDHPVVVPGFQPERGGTPAETLLREDGVIALLQQVYPQVRALDKLLGHSDGIGSNNWTISGALTATGMPILANDPHLAIQMPSIWYQIGLHCVQVGPDCPYNVQGFSFAGAPGVIIGFNDRLAWGFTNVNPDVQDLYIEKLNPDNPNQYEVNGQWVDMKVVQETIRVAKGEDVPLTVRYTRHGPIISQVYKPLKNFKDRAGVDVPVNYALVLRWTALEPSHTFEAILEMDRARTWDEFRLAASHFDVPSQNMVYADVDGNIGYQTPGRIPIRKKGDGTLPVPGWTDEYEWEGYIPFDALPNTFNPPQGYVVTANNAVVDESYPYLLTRDWNYGFRAKRIVDMIEGAPGPITLDDVKKMQGDNANLLAPVLVPLLRDLPLEGDAAKARALFDGWDGQMHMDSAPAALFAVFWNNVLALTFHDELPKEFWPSGQSRWFEVVRRLVKDPDNAWWDRMDTPERENRDAILQQAFEAAVDDLSSQQGKDPTGWRWGDLHTATFRNETLGRSGIAPIEALFNRGPFRTSGGSEIVNATSWDATKPFEVSWLPSMRMIVDMGNLDNSQAIHTTGQSGHAYHPHYIDMADRWRTIRYLPFPIGRDAVESQAVEFLRMVPSEGGASP